MSDIYEIRRDGKTLCWACSVKLLGYSTATLLGMEKHGMYIYHNGKRVRAKNLTMVGETQ